MVTLLWGKITKTFLGNQSKKMIDTAIPEAWLEHTTCYVSIKNMILHASYIQWLIKPNTVSWFY